LRDWLVDVDFLFPHQSLVENPADTEITAVVLICCTTCLFIDC